MRLVATTQVRIEYERNAYIRRLATTVLETIDADFGKSVGVTNRQIAKLQLQVCDSFDAFFAVRYGLPRPV